jgi:hypothetical protein
MPSLADCNTMLAYQEKISVALHRIRETVLEQQHAMADQQAREHGNKGMNDYDAEEGSMYNDDMKNQGFGGSDAKKRRGVRLPLTTFHRTY